MKLGQPTTTAEDFAYYQKAVPGMFFFIGVTPKERLGQAAPNHSPRFFADEGVLVPGMRALANLAVDFLVRASSLDGRSRCLIPGPAKTLNTEVTGSPLMAGCLA